MNFTVHNDDVYLLDNALSRLLHYDRDGNYVNGWDVPVAVVAVEWLENGGWLLAGRKEMSCGAALLIADSLMQIQDTVLKFGPDDTENFLCSEMFQHTPQGWLFNRPINDTLYVLDRKDGHLIGRKYCDFGNARLPGKYRSDYMKTAEALMNGDLEPYVYFSRAPLLCANYLIGIANSGQKYDSFITDCRTGATHTYRLDGKNYDPSWPVLPRALSDRNEVVCLIDPYCLPMNLSASPLLPDSVKRHVLQGGTVVALYSLNSETEQ